MKITDFRIGNLVEFEGQILQVLALDSERDLPELNLKGTVSLPKYVGKFRIGNDATWFQRIKPVPLSVEILTNVLGFYDDGFYRYFFNGHEVSYCSKNSYYSFEGSMHYFKYVHELQNKFHSYTDKELEIKGSNFYKVQYWQIGKTYTKGVEEPVKIVTQLPEVSAAVPGTDEFGGKLKVNSVKYNQEKGLFEVFVV